MKKSYASSDSGALSEFSQEQEMNLLEQSRSARLKTLCALLGPLSIGFMLDSVIGLANLLYAKSVNEPDALAAIGLAVSFESMVLLCFVLGLEGSMDTLMTQEFGAGHFEQCAGYFNKL